MQIFFLTGDHQVHPSYQHAAKPEQLRKSFGVKEQALQVLTRHDF